MTTSISERQLVRLSDVVERHTERYEDPAAHGLSRYLKVEHFDLDNLRLSRWGHVDDGQLPPTFKFVFRRGMVLYPSRSPNLRQYGRADFDGICGEKTFVVKSKDPMVLLPELLPFLFSTDNLYRHCNAVAIGSVNAHVRWRDLAAFEFALPALEEQRRIVEVLQRAMVYIDKLVMLQEAGVKTLASAASKAFAAVRGEYPSVRFSEICLKKPQSGIYKSEKYRGSGVPMVNMGELFGNDMITSEIEMERVELDEMELDRYMLTPNDLLFGRRSMVLEGAGRCVLVGAQSESMVFESSILRATLDPDKVDNRFVFEWYRSPLGHQQIRRIVTFTTVSGVAGSDVARLPVPLPPLAVQKRITNRLSELRGNVGVPTERIEEARVLARAILRRVLEAA